MRRVIFYFFFVLFLFFLRTSSARGGGGGVRCQTFSFSFFPCSADHERDWPPCKVVFFGLATNALNVRNNNNNNNNNIHTYYYIHTVHRYNVSGDPCVDDMYGHTYSKIMDQLGKVASPARGELNREK